MNNITSANATAYMTVKDLYPAGFQLNNFATDQAIDQSEDTIAETRMGVDGNMAAGYVPSIKPVNMQFEAASPTVPYLENVYLASQQNRRTYECTLVINVPSVGKVYTYTGGVMKTGKALPALKKTLDPVNYGFDFEKMTIR
jgi:hypothetical protein